MKRVAFQKSSYSEVTSLKETVFFECLNKIDRTGRIKPAGRREQRGYEFLIESDDQNQTRLHLFHLFLQSGSPDRVVQR